jgi:hypothetical protein
VLGQPFVPGAVLLVGMCAACVVFTLRRPRDYGALLAAGSGLLIVVYFFGKQAFINYYYIGAMALLFVVGSGRLAPREELAAPLERVRAALSIAAAAPLRFVTNRHRPATRARPEATRSWIP